MKQRRKIAQSIAPVRLLGIREEVEAVAVKGVTAWRPLAEAMKKKTTQALARKRNTSARCEN